MNGVECIEFEEALFNGIYFELDEYFYNKDVRYICLESTSFVGMFMNFSLSNISTFIKENSETGLKEDIIC